MPRYVQGFLEKNNRHKSRTPKSSLSKARLLSPPSGTHTAHPSGFQVTGKVKLNSNKDHIATPNSDTQSGLGY